MSTEDVISMLSGCAMNEGATELEIASLEKWAGTQLPKPYLDLIKRTNGVEGFVTDDAYLILWSAGQVAELNEAYSVAEFAPGLILIGSNGGDTGYAIDLRRPSTNIQELPLVGMSLNEAREVGTDFEDFLRRLLSIGR
jgi:SMI1 / KNR4 family (SUKH-1)